MADISKITLPNGKEYDLKDTTARNAANSAVPNTRTVNGKALSSDISLGAGDVGAYTKKETDTKINAAISIKTTTVSGTTANISAEYDTVYNCGELTSLTWTHPTSDKYGCYSICFSSGSTATEVTVPTGVKLNGEIEASKRYEINVDSNGYGVVVAWG